MKYIKKIVNQHSVWNFLKSAEGILNTFDIIIPSYGRPESLIDTLQSIVDNNRPKNFNKLILIENGGEFGARAISERFNNQISIDYIYEKTASLSKARNIGIKHSTADFLLFLDSDVKLVPGALIAYAEAFVANPSRSFFGGPLYPEYETPPPEWLLEFLPWSAKGHHLGNSNIEVKKALFLGGNFATHRSAFDTAGLFEGPCAEGSHGGGVGEETRLQERLIEKGYIGIYVAGGGIIHPVAANACDTHYVLNRYRRHGETEGLLGARQLTFQRLFMGAPLYFWRCLLLSMTALPLSWNPLESKSNRFQRKLDYLYNKAIIRGYRNVHDEHSKK